jgi:hypothetical protein
MQDMPVRKKGFPKPVCCHAKISVIVRVSVLVSARALRVRFLWVYIYVMKIIIDKIKPTFVAQTLLEAEPQPNQQIKNCCSIFEP